MSTQRRRDGGLFDAAGELAGGAFRLGYSLITLPLGLLPGQSRAHMRNALRELTYGFATLPRDFAEVAGAEIERWAADATPAPRVRPVAVESGPALGGAPVADPAEELVEESVPELIAEQVAVRLEDLGAIPAEAVGVTIAHIEFDPPGRDVDGEYVLIRNDGPAPVELGGWALSDGASRHTFAFPDFSLAPGAEVRVWTRAGANDQANLFWGSRGAIWNNAGDTGTLRDPAGGVVSSYSYEGKG